jgi:2'-5' RNA ligase
MTDTPWQFRESFAKTWEHLNESKEPSFCYMLYVAPKDEKLMKDLQNDLKLKGDLTDYGKFHATIRYVKTMMDPKPFLNHLKLMGHPTIEATTKRFAIYGQEKDALVIELESKELHDWFKKVDAWMTDHGYPRSDYPEYKPHITLTEKKDIEKPEWKKEYEQKIRLSIHIVTNTEYKEIFRQPC